MMTSSPLEIIYQDEQLVAINKPAGLLVHRSEIDRHETRFAVQLLRDQLGRRVFPVHRLDKPTAGILLFALDVETARRMLQVFTGAEVRKTYLAVARGFIPEYGRIDYPLKEQLDQMTDARARQDKEPQPAVTVFKCLAKIELPVPVGRYQSTRYSLVKLHPETGRKHQLRRHLKHIFHPIVGDTTHGDGAHNRFFRERFECAQLLLAATGLEFPHPYTAESVQLKAALELGFQRIIEGFGWQSALSEN